MYRKPRENFIYEKKKDNYKDIIFNLHHNFVLYTKKKKSKNFNVQKEIKECFVLYFRKRILKIKSC